MIIDFIIADMTFIPIYIILVLSFNLAFGFTGLVNLGHVVFFGIGAYTSAILTLDGVPWYFALILAGIILFCAVSVLPSYDSMCWKARLCNF